MNIEKLTFALTKEGDAYIFTGLNKLSKKGMKIDNKTIVIPESYNGLPVKEVGDRAFYGHDIRMK